MHFDHCDRTKGQSIQEFDRRVAIQGEIKDARSITQANRAFAHHPRSSPGAVMMQAAQRHGKIHR